MISQSSFAEPDLKEGKPFFSRHFRVMFVAVVVSFAQGLLFAADTVWSYIFELDWGMGPADTSFIGSISNVPFTLKPLWAIISDNLPLFGYRRKSYLILTALIGWISFGSFGFSAIPVTAGVIWLTMSNIFMAFQGVIGQAIVVEAAQEASSQQNAKEEQKAKSASNGVSLFYGTRLLGKVVYSGTIMLFLTELRRHEFMFYSSFIPVGVLFLSFLLPESRRVKQQTQVLSEKSPLLESQEEGSGTSSPENGMNMDNLKKAWEFIKNPVIYKSWLLIFFSNFVPNSGQTKFYYYTNFLHFSPNFLGGLKLISCGANVVGIIIYNRFCSNISLRKFYGSTIIMVVLVNLSMILLYLRLNLQWGMSDDIFVTLDTFVIDLVQELYSLPILVLACRLCPKNIEATIFAIMVSAINLATNLSSQLGAFLLNYLGITAHQFDNLWVFTIINAGIQLIPLFVLFTIKFEEAIVHASQSHQENSCQVIVHQDDEKYTVDSHSTVHHSTNSKELDKTL